MLSVYSIILDLSLYQPVGKPGADLVVSGYRFLKPSEFIVSSDQLSTKRHYLVTIIKIRTFPYITLCHLRHPAVTKAIDSADTA